jgi:hypothetical protein
VPTDDRYLITLRAWPLRTASPLSFHERLALDENDAMDHRGRKLTTKLDETG